MATASPESRRISATEIRHPTGMTMQHLDSHHVSYVSCETSMPLSLSFSQEVQEGIQEDGQGYAQDHAHHYPEQTTRTNTTQWEPPFAGLHRSYPSGGHKQPLVIIVQTLIFAQGPQGRTQAIFCTTPARLLALSGGAPRTSTGRRAARTLVAPPRTSGNPPIPRQALCDLQVVAAVLFGGWAGRLDGGEGFEDPVCVRRAPGNRPGISGVERYHRPL